MQFFILPVEDLKDLCPNLVEHARKDNDGTIAIVHKETVLNVLEERGQYVAPLVVDGEEYVEPTYPYELKTGEEINAMLEFQSKEKVSSV